MLVPVQDRYAGDIGDFLKFGLLRALCSGKDSALRLGVCWYRVANEYHNNDGRHVSYLSPTNRHSRSLKACDPELFVALSQLVDSDQRTVRGLEAAGILPRATITYDRLLHGRMTRSERHAWHDAALKRLRPAQIVFLDPDNGLGVERTGRGSEKMAFLSEVTDYSVRGQSLIVYHHADRSTGGVPAQVSRRAAELQHVAAGDVLGAIVCRRTSVRFFFVVSAPDHAGSLRKMLAYYAERWSHHVEYAPYDR
jgi:hypothetical protein